MQTRWKTLLTVAGLSLAASLGAGRATPPAAAAEVDVDVSVFYTSLAPYGEWVQLETYGWSWVPENVAYDWRPYTLGRWEWVEPIGWTWVSEEPFGWATYHYGRWTYVSDYGWAWVPGTTWGPAWVAFRYGDPWVGWAPLPPGPSWRFDAAYDVGHLNLDVHIDAYAWSFVPVRYFAERDLRTRVYVTAYSSYFMQRTQWSTRYATIEGGYANQSLDPVVVERSRGTPVVRRRLREGTAPALDSPPTTANEDVVVYRPRIRAEAPAQAPTPRVRGDRSTRASLDSWTAERRAAIQARLDAQKKALEEEQPGATPATPNQPQPGMATDDDAAKRREAGMRALEDERKRLETLLERQRRRREQEQPAPTPPPAPKNPPPPPPTAPPAPPPAPPAPPGMGDDGHGRGMDDDGHGNGMGDDHHGMK